MLALNYVKKNLRAGGFAQAVLAYLADCMNEADGKCFPSRETMDGTTNIAFLGFQGALPKQTLPIAMGLTP